MDTTDVAESILNTLLADDRAKALITASLIRTLTTGHYVLCIWVDSTSIDPALEFHFPTEAAARAYVARRFRHMRAFDGPLPEHVIGVWV